MIQISDSVFINCPFDEQYMPLLRAMVFAIYRSGFYPRCAMEEDDGLDSRLSKILRIIAECKYGIHDISRTELNPGGLPRFNMPFELGLFYACKHFGDGFGNKVAAIFEHTKYSYQQTLSDLNGVDTKDHGGDYRVLIRKTSSWLATASKRRTVPGHLMIIEDFDQFELDLPQILFASGLTLETLTFNDLTAIIEEWLSLKLSST
jgi:hypothetical protein